MNKGKPIIGVVGKYKEITDDRQEVLIRDEVKNAIINNGGIAIGILPTETEINFTPANSADIWEETLTDEQKQDLITQMNLCDGIILQGGACSLKYESWIAKYTFDHDIPTLGICAGQNALVRGVGGTTKKVDNPEKHNQKWVDIVHPIFIDKNSKFYSIVKCEEMMVNSRHNRTVDNPTSHYKIVAVCDDGYLDVVEAENKRFNIGLRFHPETLYKQYECHNAIFKAFIEECKK